MPRLTEVKKIQGNFAYRYRALRLLRHLVDDIVSSKSTPTCEQVLALASTHTHYDCACFCCSICCTVQFTGGFLFYYFLLTHGPPYLQTVLAEQLKVCQII